MRGFLYIGLRVASFLKYAIPILAAGAILQVGMLLVFADSTNRRSLTQVILGLAAFCLFDALLIFSLPRLGLSFGPSGFSIFFLLFVRMAIFLAWAMVFARSIRLDGAAVSPTLYWMVNVVMALVLVYGYMIEPFAIQVTRLQVPVQDGLVKQQLRIVQLSDLHVERTTRREREIARLVKELKPDLIVLTGDYLNLSYLADPRSVSDARDLLAQLHAPLGVFAVNGSVDNEQRMQALFSGLDITVLNDKVYSLQASGANINLVGVIDWDISRDAAALQRLALPGKPGAYNLLLFHTPDLVHEASRAGIDLYLCGHTHGGQIRLPVYGAIVTASAFGKQFESGRYQVGPTTLYVSRGLGLEGGFAPRVRFLARPEIVVVDLIPAPAAGSQ